MDVNFTSSGHYTIPVSKSYKVLDKFDKIQNNNSYNKNSHWKKLKKIAGGLHEQ